MKIGIIGYGARMSGYFNDKTILEGFVDCILNFDMGVKIAAITDINIDRVKYILGKKSIDAKNISFYSNADEMLDKEELDGILVGTNCSSHAKIAIKILKRNLPLSLEKPISTCMEDLMSLKKAYNQSKSKVVVSFPLKLAPLTKLAKEIIQSGKLGTIEHVQAINNVPYGGVYFHSWYRNEAETGGLFLQKATHDFDYINYLLNIRPVMICAMKSKQIFKGDKPVGLLCNDCDEYETCTESPFIMKHFKCENQFVLGDMCCFAKDTGNEDSGSALISYETGMHVSYSQNFFTRKGAGVRGARFLGYNGTLELSWTNSDIKVFMHNTPEIETYKLDTSQMSHAGGDEALAYNFIRVMQGKEETKSPIEDGFLSVLMCLKAKESAETNTFQMIRF